MKIENIILKEELTWGDVTQKYSGNSLLLRHIMKAGQDPRNQIDGKTDWGSAIDLGNAEYQREVQKQQTQKAKKDSDKISAEEPKAKRKQGAQIGNQNAFKGGSDIQQRLGLSDLPKVDTSTVSRAATTSYDLGKKLAQIGGSKATYNKPSNFKLAASKKNLDKKL
jgi:hypothetical protein